MAAIYSILEVADRLGLAYSHSFNASCPFCGGKSKSLHLEPQKNVFRCNKCDTHGGVLNLFARLQLGWETIPSDKKGRQKLAAQLREFMGDSEAAVNSRPKPRKPASKITPVASDSHLNAVYTAMAQIPELALTPEHRAELRRRGLTDEAIDQNGYRTLPERFKAPEDLLKLYDTMQGTAQR